MRIRFYSLMLFIFTIVNLFQPFAVRAADKAEELAPVKVTASRDTVSEENIPASMTVITEAEIKKRAHVQVQDILREELGMDVVRNGSFGGSTSVFLRGTGSSSTLVLIDGAHVNSNTSGNFDFHDLNAGNIEKIEILRGPQSTLWGADALGGVINIVTKKGEGTPTHTFGFEGGSFHTARETAGSSGAIGAFDYSLNASHTGSGGISSASERRGGREKDFYENTSISTRTGTRFLQDGRVEFIGRYIKSANGFDAFAFSTGLPTDAANRSDTESFYISVPIQKAIARWWDLKLAPHVAYDALRSFDATTNSTSGIFNRTYTLDIQNNLELGKFFSAAVGAELQKKNGENPGSQLSKNIDNQGYYLQTAFNYEDRIVLTGGFRHDVNSVYQDKTTYKFEGSYRFREWGTRVRSAYGTGFRAPTLNDLFFPNFGNPNLKPEESESWEAGFDQSFLENRLVVGSTYFDSKLTNLIQFDSLTFLPQNISKATSKGVETYAKIKLPEHFFVRLNHTWNDALDEHGHPLRRRAEHKFSANVQHDWREKLSSLVGVAFRSGAKDGRFNTEGYTVVRAALSYQALKNVKLTVRGENLLDKRYEEIPGFGAPGISGYAGFVYDF
ncbi:MAG: TonB-dependent receptor [Nitrospinae bacterium]|nr:TonB-dependent receptor [Nitrospinota bacterium]